MNIIKELFYRFCGEYTMKKLISMEMRMQQKRELQGKIGYID